MEENIGQTLPPPFAPNETGGQASKPWLKVGLLVVLGLILAGGLVWAGYWYGKNSKLKSQSSKLQLKTQKLTPTSVPVVTSQSISPSEPTSSPLPSEAPAKEDDETAGWKIYTNTKYGYSIKYSFDWKKIEAQERSSFKSDDYRHMDTTFFLVDEANETQKITFIEKSSEHGRGTFQIRVLSNPRTLTLDQWVNNYRVPFAGGGNAVRKTENINLGGKPAKRLSIFGFTGDDLATVAINGGNVYYLSFHDYYIDEKIENSLIEKNKNIYSFMLSAFKFLD